MVHRMPGNSIFSFIVFISIFISSCASFHVTKLPPPPATAKLRVFVQAYSGPGNWGRVPHEAFVRGQIKRIERHLAETGIYEVVDSKDIRAVLGEQLPTKDQMQRNSWALARQIGRALHADYAIIMERAWQKGSLGDLNIVFNNVMVNVTTGKTFTSHNKISHYTKADFKQAKRNVTETYRVIFQSAKEDMLATAIAKSERISEKKEPVAPTLPGNESKEAAKSAVDTVAPEKKAPLALNETDTSLPELSDSEYLKRSESEKGLTEDPSPVNGPKLVVYDLAAPENFKTAALILTEALREEIYRLKRFILVNREDLEQVLKEIALQQTGLIDEKEAVKTGRGLAANQVVTGRLGQLGKTYMLQAKRIDVETFATLGLASAKFKQGQEDEVLSQLPEIARSLVGTK